MKDETKDKVKGAGTSVMNFCKGLKQKYDAKRPEVRNMWCISLTHVPMTDRQQFETDAPYKVYGSPQGVVIYVPVCETPEDTAVFLETLAGGNWSYSMVDILRKAQQERITHVNVCADASTVRGWPVFD